MIRERSQRTGADKRFVADRIFRQPAYQQTTCCTPVFRHPRKYKHLVNSFTNKPPVHCLAFKVNHFSVTKNKNSPHSITNSVTNCFFGVQYFGVNVCVSANHIASLVSYIIFLKRFNYCLFFNSLNRFEFVPLEEIEM